MSYLTFRQFINESINDRGILKAVFVVGIPGAGKSYTVGKLGGAVSPRIVNTDRASEYLSKKLGRPVSGETWADFRDDAHRITKATLGNYLNSMLPLFIDGTSNDVSNILHRAGILESLGYDVGMIFIDTPLEVAKQRAKERAKTNNRHVDEDFIERVHALAAENRNYFKSKFQFFREIKNGTDELTDDALLEAFRKTTTFFDAPVNNPVGQRYLSTLQSAKDKYLVPQVLSKQELDKKLDGWYK